MRRKIRRVMTVALGTFFLSIFLNWSSTTTLRFVSLWPSVFLLAIIVLIGVLFDIIGVAATAAIEAPFHAMAVDRVQGSRQSIWLVRNADKVGTFCNDVVGDIAGTLSGAVATAIAYTLTRANADLSEYLLTTFMVALAAAGTVGGKAYGKSIAIENANEIVHVAGRFLHVIEGAIGLNLIQVGNNKSKRRKDRNKGKQRGKEVKK